MANWRQKRERENIRNEKSKRQYDTEKPQETSFSALKTVRASKNKNKGKQITPNFPFHSSPPPPPCIYFPWTQILFVIICGSPINIPFSHFVFFIPFKNSPVSDPPYELNRQDGGVCSSEQVSIPVTILSGQGEKAQKQKRKKKSKERPSCRPLPAAVGRPPGQIVGR